MVYQLNQQNFDINYFLENIWQQKPAVIKQGFVDFLDPLSADELAGLAGEEHIESRLISHKNQQWHLQEGPITEFIQLGDKDWTLVVQSVNHWHETADKLSKAFNFIPQWRLDDVMVSFACQGGSVGPHVDNYDVFICQGSGKRRWQVGVKENLNEVLAHAKLRHVASFTPIIDEVIESGDILYIPPGFPHAGVSLDNSMSFSVGYQAIKDTDLFSHFADFLIDNNTISKLLCDSKRSVQPYAQISTADIEQLNTLLRQLLNDKRSFSTFLGSYFSQSFHDLDTVETDYNEAEWDKNLTQNPLKKINAVKFLWLENNAQTLYINGETYSFSKVKSLDCIHVLCNHSVFTQKELTPLLQNKSNKKILIELTNLGYLYF